MTPIDEAEDAARRAEREAAGRNPGSACVGAEGAQRRTGERNRKAAGSWSRGLNAARLDGSYLPRAVRRVDIPKPQGGVRPLGVPTVVDRLIQQALRQVMQPIAEPMFSDSSYGFRPGRSAGQAACQSLDMALSAYRRNLALHPDSHPYVPGDRTPGSVLHEKEESLGCR